MCFLGNTSVIFLLLCYESKGTTRSVDSLPCAGEEAVRNALGLDRRRDQPDLEIAISVAGSPNLDPSLLLLPSLSLEALTEEFE